VWGGEADLSLSVSSANLWFVAATSITTLGSVGVAWISHRRERAAKSEAADAIDDAIDSYKRMIADPLKRDRDMYQKLWQQCMERHDH
jgi:uncharacterized membrane protein YfbV (UPF0208 family)